MASNGRLTGKQERALLALLSERTVEEAATVARVGTRTLFTWLRNPDFCDAYHEARARAVSQAISRLQQVSSQAVDTLENVMGDVDSVSS